jgi:hypothetical protein
VKQQERKRRYGAWSSAFNELPLKIESKDGKIDDDDNGDDGDGDGVDGGGGNGGGGDSGGDGGGNGGVDGNDVYVTRVGYFFAKDCPKCEWRWCVRCCI